MNSSVSRLPGLGEVPEEQRGPRSVPTVHTACVPGSRRCRETHGGSYCLLSAGYSPGAILGTGRPELTHASRMACREASQEPATHSWEGPVLNLGR